MLQTRQDALRRFWYPVIPVADLAAGPRPFTLLGQQIVLWQDGAGQVSALADRCLHRTARLSKGFVENGVLKCGYHGWEFAADGRCLRIPQRSADTATRTGSLGVERFHAEAKYGWVWVALGTPLAPIPEFEEASDPRFRHIHEFYEPWDCASLRVMENSFDNAHFSFVHRASFGDQGHPAPAKLDLTEDEHGFLMVTEVPVRNPAVQRQNLGMDEEWTVRHMRARWYLPFVRKLQITYPNGLVHSIVTAATPVDDRSCQVVQFVYRNDTEEQAPSAGIIAFDRTVTEEDRGILESTDPDVPLDQSGVELNMASDRPGVVMRRMILDLLNRLGEPEATAHRQPARAAVAAE